MTAEEIPSTAYAQRHFPRQQIIRHFGDWQIISATPDGHFWLLLINE